MCILIALVVILYQYSGINSKYQCMNNGGML